MRIETDAFGDACQCATSPSHRVFVRDQASKRLISAGYHVNGITIVQESVGEVDYVHVELDQHDILCRRRPGAESYLDVAKRAEFENGGGLLVLHPAFAPLAHEAACALFIVAGPVLKGIRVRLSEIAEVDTK